MITYVYGDLFYSPARVLVNPVNTVGTMGTGLAQDFKRFYPDMYAQYEAHCQDDQLNIGQLMLYKTPHKWVLNIPIKRHAKAGSRLEYIEAGLKKFTIACAEFDFVSVSFPQLGTEAGDLAWDEVRPLMESYLAPLPASIYIHDRTPTPYTPEKRSLHTLRNWLTHLPQQITFDQFWEAMDEVVREGRDWQTLTGAQAFSVVVTHKQGRQRLSLKITPARAETIFLPETQLRDLWHYVRRAGYVLPQNLPAGLEAYADYIVALLAALPYLQPVQLAPRNGRVVVGLHYIPAIAYADDAQVIQL